MGHWREERSRTATTKSTSTPGKVSDLEGRARRNNIRLYGVPEDTEGTSTAAYVENLIKRELGGDLSVEGNLGIERAHRALGPKPPAGAPPRSIVVRFIRFTTKEERSLSCRGSAEAGCCDGAAAGCGRGERHDPDDNRGIPDTTYSMGDTDDTPRGFLKNIREKLKEFRRQDSKE
ncbi:hypothetical protein WMY93_032419 [Mugilogobius chulae]|uniref:Uncharacterized protein n=1 Tax=Mugilogobius chulae TaxID=88201 RepID=A0AAW0MJM4_9GOBI